MAEVGLLPLARVALQGARTVPSRYRTQFSKHKFTQPQLLTILRLMRQEDWTFCEAGARLAETYKLRAAGGAGLPAARTIRATAPGGDYPTQTCPTAP